MFRVGKVGRAGRVGRVGRVGMVGREGSVGQKYRGANKSNNPLQTHKMREYLISRNINIIKHEVSKKQLKYLRSFSKCLFPF